MMIIGVVVLWFLLKKKFSVVGKNYTLLKESVIFWWHLHPSQSKNKRNNASKTQYEGSGSIQTSERKREGERGRGRKKVGKGIKE